MKEANRTNTKNGTFYFVNNIQNLYFHNFTDVNLSLL